MVAYSCEAEEWGELVGSKNSPLSLGGPGPPRLGPPPFSAKPELENLKGFHPSITYLRFEKRW